MTPYELNIYAEACKNRTIEETKEKITLAYVNAAWTIQWIGKKHQHPKPLKEILENIGKEKRIMTDDEMLERVKALNAMFGGEVKEDGQE